MSPRARTDVELPLLTLLQHGVRWFAEQLPERLEAAGVAPITPAHTTVLAQLEGDTAVSIAELARRAQISRQSMHRNVTQLVTEGLLISTPGAGFPRSSTVTLTPAGLRRREVAMRVLAELEAELADQLGPEAVAQLRASLSRAWP